MNPSQARRSLSIGRVKRGVCYLISLSGILSSKSDMDDHVLTALEDLKYDGALSDAELFAKEIEDPKSTKFTGLVSWLSTEIKSLCNLEDHVNAITDVDDWNTFLLEISAFLKEMQCPMTALTDGPVSQRLMTKENRLFLLGFLCDELQAARMIKVLRPESGALQVQMEESPVAKAMKGMLMTLGFGKPPPTITPAQLFSKAESKVRELVPKAGPTVMSKPLFLGGLTEKQWFALAKLQAQMQEEYRVRRETLIKRLDVTIQSFKWAERLKGMEDKIMAAYQPRRRLMEAEPSVSVGHVLAAREDLTMLEKTSGAGVRKNTKSAVNRVLIGNVPDRGGRPEEQQSPPPEMPSWQKRTDGPQGGGGRGGGTSYSTGRIQGAGWDAQRGDGRGDQGGGGYGGGYGQRDQRESRGGRGGGRGGGRDGGYQGGGYGHQDSYGGGGYGGGGGYKQDNYGQREGGGGRGGYRGGRGGGGRGGGRQYDR
ncbi:protein FAM98A [Haemaphysalis longicornis]